VVLANLATRLHVRRKPGPMAGGFTLTVAQWRTIYAYL
jgi:hypothetical protein